MITSTVGVITVMLLMVTTSLFLQRIKIIKSYLGPAMMVILLGIVLSNVGIMPFYQDAYGVIMTYAVPMFIAIMLLSVDLRELFTLSKRALLAMGVAIFSVSLVTIVAGLFFAGNIDEGWKIGGMFVGTYTGGSANLSAIAVALDAEPMTLAAANAADYVIGMPTLILMFALPGILKMSEKFQKFWPYSIPTEILEHSNETAGLMERKEWGIGDIAAMLAYALVVTQVSTYLAGFVPADYFSVARILSVTTIALIAAQTPMARKIKGNMDLGLYISMLFLCVIGLSVSLKAFAGSALAITGFCAVVIIGSLVLHIIITRLLKIEYQYVLISITSSIADGTTSALVAAGAGWKSIVSVAVVLGIIGNVAGNYLGVGIAYLLKMIVGA